MSDVKEQFS